MRLLLHVCCGPCSIMPITRLREAGHELTGYFYNPNIHPMAEYLRRREGAAAVAEKLGLPMIFATDEGDYNTIAWTAKAVQRMQQPNGEIAPDARCIFCWEERLIKTAYKAQELGFDGFSSSLLYSKWQKHAGIAEAGRRAEKLVQEHFSDAILATTSESSEQNFPHQTPVFHYADFRSDWQEGVRLSREWSIYRQQYCGCIYSENDRYAKDLTKANAELAAKD